MSEIEVCTANTNMPTPQPTSVLQPRPQAELVFIPIIRTSYMNGTTAQPQLLRELKVCTANIIKPTTQPISVHWKN